MDRRTFVASALTGLAGVSATVGATSTDQKLPEEPGPLGDDTVDPSGNSSGGSSTVSTESIEPVTIDVAVFAREELLDNPIPGVEYEAEPTPRHDAKELLEHALTDFADNSGVVSPDNVSVRVEETPVKLDTEASNNILTEFRDFEDWIGDRPDLRADDSNVLLSHRSGGGIGYAPTCQLDTDGDGVCERTWDADISVVRDSKWWYVPYYGKNLTLVDTYAVGSPYGKGRIDIDGDAEYEDFNRDGKFTWSDVNESLFDDNVPFNETVDLLFELSDFDPIEYVTPEWIEKGSYAWLLHATVHEVGHNLGFQHDMGSILKETEDAVYVTTMYGTYPYSFPENPPNVGDENRVGQVIPELNDRDVVYVPRYGNPIKDNEDWFYDETS